MQKIILRRRGSGKVIGIGHRPTQLRIDDITKLYLEDGMLRDDSVIQLMYGTPIIKDSANMLTTTKSYDVGNDGSIRNGMLRISGFNSAEKGMLTDPRGNVMDVETFLASLKVISTHEIIDNDGYEIMWAGGELPFRLVTQKYGKGHLNYDDICDDNGEIYMELDFMHPTKHGGNSTFDGYVGSNMDLIVNEGAFEVTWLTNKNK